MNRAAVIPSPASAGVATLPQSPEPLSAPAPRPLVEAGTDRGSSAALEAMKQSEGGPPGSVETFRVQSDPPADVIYEVNPRLPVEVARQMHRYQAHPKERWVEQDPITHPRPNLVTRQTPVATIGSCFVVEIRRWLVDNNFNYVRAEFGPGTKQASARVGRVFNTGTLRQIAERSHGLFKPVERYWAAEGLLLDPYRQGIAWPDQQSAEIELRLHAAALADMFRRCQVLICTLGVSEAWRHREDRAYFHRVPPAPAFDADRHEFVRIGPDESVANLERFYALAREHNPSLQLILTLSPVPLEFTFRDMSLVCADAVSKSILRLAIDTFLERHPEVIYFPAFEIVRAITPDPWDPDYRHVNPRLIRMIMTRFMQHYGPPGETYRTPKSLRPPDPAANAAGAGIVPPAATIPAA